MSGHIPLTEDQFEELLNGMDSEEETEFFRLWAKEEGVLAEELADRCPECLDLDLTCDHIDKT